MPCNGGKTMAPTAATAALSNHFCIPISTRVPPVSGVILIVSAEESPVRSLKRARLSCLDNTGVRNLKRLHFIFAVKKIAQLRTSIEECRLQHRDNICCPLINSFLSMQSRSRTVNDVNMKTILISFCLSHSRSHRPLHFSQNAIDGFSTASARGPAPLGRTVSRHSNAKSAREHLRLLTREPHIAGTKEDYDTAIYVRDQLRSYGLSAELKEYDVWLNYPNTPSMLELITTRRQKLSTHEAVVPGDPSSSHPKITPLFNGYAASGDVTAPVVYANYGLPNDYEELKKQESTSKARS